MVNDSDTITSDNSDNSDSSEKLWMRLQCCLAKYREMQRNAKKCREMQRNAEKSSTAVMSGKN